MLKVDIKADELSAMTGITTKQIRRWINDPAPRPEVENLMMVCIAMHLTPRNSYKLFELAGIVLREASPLESMYIAILESGIESISECNELLEERGFRPLTIKSIIEEQDVSAVLYADAIEE